MLNHAVIVRERQQPINLAHHGMRSAIYKWVHPRYDGMMTARLTIDGDGRIVIPKPLRNELDLAPGDALELETAL